MSVCIRTVSLALIAGLFVSICTVSAHARMGGSWSGSGYIKPSNGERTNVRCRVRYSRQTPKIYSVRATCASKGQSLRQTGEVLMVRPNRFVGDFYSQQFDVGGRISITLRGSRQTVTFSGDGVSGRLTLRRR